jgi:hypothetical protein
MAVKIVHNVFDKKMAYSREISDELYRVAMIAVDRRGVHFEIRRGDKIEVKEYYTDPEKLEKRMRDAFPDGKWKGWGISRCQLIAILFPSKHQQGTI